MRSFHFLVIVAPLLACACSRPVESDAARVVLQVAARDIALVPDTIVVSARVTAGATLATILHSHEVLADDVIGLIERAGSVFDLRKVRVNQPYRLEKTAGGTIKCFDYEIDADRFLRVMRGPEDGAAALNAVVLPIPKLKKIEHVAGEINRTASSLVTAMDAAGETIDLTLAMAEVLGGEIDFSTELQPGDRFQLAVEKQYRPDRDGGFAGYGPIAAVEFVNAGRRVRAIRFAPDGGQPGYYDERGNSMKRFFLASPLKFNPVVTSAFSRSRMHPILHERRAHLGVDYRAPAGSPVVAVSDGVVVSAGVSGGAGRMVHLRHANGFESEYLHLSAITVRPGARVQQGELIGRVGSSGLATAAHLDYRLKKNGVFINPLTAHRQMPPGEPVPATEMAAFADVRDRALAALGMTTRAGAANPNSSIH